MAFLFRFVHGASVICSGLTFSRVPPQSVRKKMPNILCFHKSNPLPSNLFNLNNFLASKEVEAIFAH
ncbi:hypothetical protein KP509_29G081500 [Ceratopteris richardii]|uniref:Uncharacterized protein n=1 Tax=Ceratopteris richardii TaxID=49495 RepID=A0A8T2R9W5_CERRI|nr:hypothetical protein KP509_29G081500 [Ceratopteris richardii]